MTVDGLLGGFQFLLFRTVLLMNRFCPCLLAHTGKSCSRAYTLRVEFLGLGVYTYLTLLGNIKLFSMGLCQFTFPPEVCKCSSCSLSSPMLGIFRCLNFLPLIFSGTSSEGLMRV